MYTVRNQSLLCLYLIILGPSLAMAVFGVVCWEQSSVVTGLNLVGPTLCCLYPSHQVHLQALRSLRSTRDGILKRSCTIPPTESPHGRVMQGEKAGRLCDDCTWLVPTLLWDAVRFVLLPRATERSLKTFSYGIKPTFRFRIPARFLFSVDSKVLDADWHLNSSE